MAKDVSLRYKVIYQTVRKIPYGKVATYGQIAELSGLAGHARQVGYALFRVAPEEDVPWYRVVNAKGEISRSPQRLGGDDLQRVLLEQEGIEFNAQDRIIAFKSCLWQPSFIEHPFICFLSGASGVGKTTIVAALKSQNCFPDYEFLHFDSIGIPSIAEMIEQAESGKKWQELATERWIEKISTDYNDRRVVLIEGQTNLEFIEAACHKFKIKNYLIILIDCSWETSKERLLYDRQQPELVSQDMENWTNFLRRQAKSKKIPIIDTTSQSLEQSVQSIAILLQQAMAKI
jgi:alkylated DNA nucleotide flippase Atl1/shikimate kinase